MLHQRGAKQRRAVDAAGLRARGDVAQVGRLHTGGQGKAGAFDAGIHRPDDGLVAGVFGPLHQLQRVLALGLGIELKPQRPAPLQSAAGVLCLVRNRLQRVAAQGKAAPIKVIRPEGTPPEGAEPRFRHRKPRTE